MYIVYEEHIELLEKENKELEKQVHLLRRRLDYYKGNPRKGERK